MSRRAKYLLATGVLFAMEVAIALGFSGHTFVRGYLGDFLVVILLFCAAKSVRDFGSGRLALYVFTFAVLIETAQYFRLADVMGLSQYGVARVVLGSTFSVGDLLMYAAGCIGVYVVDARFGPPPPPSSVRATPKSDSPFH